jgi:integrase/recombinase XerD
MAIIPMKDLKGYLEPEEIEKLLNSCNSLVSYLIIRILWRTGMRVSELISLKVSDILWKERIIIVKTLKKKGHQERRIPIDQKTLDLLKKYLEERKNKSNLIFPFTRQWVFNLIRKIGKKAGITKVGEKKLHPHHLRHSFAIFCIKRGMDLRKLQMILGHASISTTAHYLQFSPIELEEEYDKIWEGIE